VAFGCLVVIEQVLATESPTLSQASAIPEGLMLLHALSGSFRVTLSTLEPEPDVAERFLLFAGVRKSQYDQLLSPLPPQESPTQMMRRHINRMREQTELAYVVTADPEVARRCINVGITPMLCPHPKYAAPSFLPTAGDGKKSWADLVDTLTEQRFLRDNDKRADDDDSEV
jgi:hypothetical protein